MNQSESWFYEAQLRIHFKDWEGKRVLDLGAGQGGTVSLDLQKRHINIEMVSLSPHYKDKSNTVTRMLSEQGDAERAENFVAGNGLHLPFADQSFDAIVSVRAVPMYLNTEAEFEQVIKEIERILKPGGEARLTPGLAKSQGGHLVPFPEAGVDWVKAKTKLVAEYLEAEHSDPVLVLRKPLEGQADKSD